MKRPRAAAGFDERMNDAASAMPSARRRGACTVWLLITVLLIAGIVAMGMDGGRMFEKRRDVQAAADAAALAAAADLCDSNYYNRYRRWNRTQREGRMNGFDLAAANGFANDGVTSKVTVNIPPTSGAFKGVKECAEVIIEYKLPKTFSHWFDKDSATIKARAVAIGRPARMGLIMLRQTGPDAFLNKCTGVFTMLKGRIYVNSTDSAAFHQTKPGAMVADSYEIAGNYVNSGGAVLTGKMNTGVRRIADPLRELPVPDPALLMLRSSTRYVVNTKRLVTLQPGIYRGGIQLDLLDHAFMQLGIYYIQGGGLQVTGASDLVGTGVLIYNTGDAANPAGPITIATLGKVAMTAPTSGPYQGIGVFQDRAVAQPMTFSGTGVVTMTGLVYAPAAPVKLIGLIGGKLDTLGGAYVCHSLEVNGIGNINIDLADNAPPVPEIALVE